MSVHSGASPGENPGVKNSRLYIENFFTNKVKNKMQKTKNDLGNQNSGSLSNQRAETSVNEAKKTYTCSMHPEVISDKPGKCPKCGMVLIEKK